ncbi:MAG: signal peptide peptidase SppA [Chloroflexi bacterium]|nr:signal peptide peptidase SppA [Chloroflexota bacterium]
MSNFRVRIQDIWRNGWVSVGNLARRASRQRIDYVVIDLAGSLPEFILPSAWWQRYLPPVPGFPAPADGLSLLALRLMLERIAADPRPKGVVLRLDDFAPEGWATVCSVRNAIARFRATGKRVVAYADEFSNATYFLATAADQITLPPGGGWNVFGLRLDLIFLKDALDAYGIQAEVVNVAPYKTAGDTFARSDISPEHREMLDWILDGQHEEIVSAIAAGRRMEARRVRELIDSAPKLAHQAMADGLVDAVCYFDELPVLLDAKTDEGKRNGGKRGKKNKAEPGAKFVTWRAANRLLVRPLRWRSGKSIAVITLEGTIIPGKSQRLPIPLPLPFVGNAMAGSESVAQAFRRAENDDAFAAIVFHVDSRGGAAGASDSIWREVARVRTKKPVVVYMANYAASGGYYVSAGANWIVAQPLTVTGSIGVIILKFVAAGLFDRFRARQVHLERGAHAGLFGSDAPFGDSGRPVVQKMIDELYRQFKRIVVDGRNMEEAKLDSIAGGRVWLGKQALTHGLVDQIGDLRVAVEKAQELAELKPDDWTPPVWVGSGKGGLLPPPFPTQSWADVMGLVAALVKEKAWMIAPFEVEIK